MLEIKQDIWKANFMHDAIVIPTNIGWNARGEAVMGRGLAAQAARKFPDLRATYAVHCQKHRAATPLLYERFLNIMGGRWLILFPTKPFREDAPAYSWQVKSDMALIERGLHQLAALAPPSQSGKIYVPLLGCGFGGLPREPVRELMDRILAAGHFVRVRE